LRYFEELTSVLLVVETGLMLRDRYLIESAICFAYSTVSLPVGVRRER
jgi:hypothetical protein